MEALPLIIITIVALFYFHPILKKALGYVDTMADVLEPMAKLQNKRILTELEQELAELLKATTPTPEKEA